MLVPRVAVKRLPRIVVRCAALLAVLAAPSATAGGRPSFPVPAREYREEMRTLRHHVVVKHACVFDVTLDERPEASPSD
jgi:hypothetical protein